MSTSLLCTVAGATGGVGKRVVQRLLEQGRVVRALVRDVDKAKSLLVSSYSTTAAHAAEQYKLQPLPSSTRAAAVDAISGVPPYLLHTRCSCGRTLGLMRQCVVPPALCCCHQSTCTLRPGAQLVPLLLNIVVSCPAYPQLCLQASLPVGPSGALQLVAADISQRKTLTPDMFKGVCAVISCTAVKVQPKEGDTPDREKYYQVGTWLYMCWQGG